MKYPWPDLKFWETGECQVVMERLSDLRKARKVHNPSRENLFRALQLTPFDKVKVVICGQDPYPDSRYATGLAFSIPPECKDWPPTLTNLLKEYSSDLFLPEPGTGDLSKWAAEGVLLWNVIPSCLAGASMSHEWNEWADLTVEILKKLSDKPQKDVVFCFLGGVARGYVTYVDDQNDIIQCSHPSPRGSLKAKDPFIGSRIFSTINDKLVAQGVSPINWRL